jgi:hypothetical protein
LDVIETKSYEYIYIQRGCKLSIMLQEISFQTFFSNNYFLVWKNAQIDLFHYANLMEEIFNICGCVD